MKYKILLKLHHLSNFCIARRGEKSVQAVTLYLLSFFGYSLGYVKIGSYEKYINKQ